MDPRDRTLDELVEQFMYNPGPVESEQLDFKAKEKVESTEGKRDIAKLATAMANTRGGSIIVGVGEGNRDDIIQSFDSRTEIKRDLVNVFRDNTTPPLDRLTSIEVEQSSTGPRLLRIDIEPAEKYPVRFYDRNSGEHVPYHRVEDTTREMTSPDIVEFAERSTSSGRTQNADLSKTMTVEQSDIQIFDESSPRRSPPNRAILNIDEHALIVPTSAHLRETFQKSLTFHVEKDGEPGISGLNGLLKEAEKELNADFGYSFGYGIRYGSKQVTGRTVDNYLDDIRNLDETLRLLGGENDSDPRPVAIGGTRCDFGFVWFQAQYHTGSLSRIKCGLVMSDIPINTNPIERMFGNGWFKQNNSLRELRLQLRGGEVPLSNTRAVLFDKSDSAGRTDIVADNPYYRNKNAIIESAESEAAEPFIEAICSVDRLPFDVRGGYSDRDIYHTVSEIHMGFVHGVVPTYFVWPLCNPHTEAPSEEPSDPEFIKSLKSDDSQEESEKNS